MQFNSYIFILLFLPVTVFLYFMANYCISINAGNILLILASFIYYMYIGKRCFCILLFSILINYLLSRAIKDKKSNMIFAITIAFNIGILLYFKYCNFFILNVNKIFKHEYSLQNIILPLGISFITFQQIAYIVNIYKGKMPEHSFFDYLLFIIYFPKIIMGPLVDPIEFMASIKDQSRRYLNSENFVIGIRMFNLGLFKKLIFADTFAKAVNWGFANISSVSSVDLIIVMLAYTFQIYFDFSGYSDMAIGISKLFNIELPMNFNSPYKAYSIRDFWKRWHMSLTGFLTKYIYFPLGGNRKGRTRTYVNMIIVFLVSGFWHGANWTFILWGALHGMIASLERIFDDKLKKVHQGFKWFITFIITNILWLLFRSESIIQWKNILKDILRFQDTSVSSALIACFNLPETHAIYRFSHLLKVENAVRGFDMLVFFIAAFTIVMLFENNYKRRYRNNILTVILSVCIFVWSLISLGCESSFVYFGF